MNEKKSFFSDSLKPVLILTVICLIISALLGVTNAVTEPIILENEAAAALKDRQELLPAATGFTEIPYAEDERVESVYADDGGSGVIITVGAGGYGGTVVTTVAIGPDGAVQGVRINANTETKGVGTKITLPAFTDGLIGITSADGIDVIAGATYSSRAVIDSVDLALGVYASLGGAQR